MSLKGMLSKKLTLVSHCRIQLRKMYTKEHLTKKMFQQGKVHSPWIHSTEDVMDSQFRKSQKNMLCMK
jgi:hypothetical protein